MDWSQYTYLAGAGFAALVVLAVATHLAPSLVKPNETRRRPLQELTLLGAILILGIAIIYWNCFFGSSLFGYWGIGSDTLDEYVPYYIDMINSIKGGTWGLWDFTYGLGTTFMAYDVWAFDPFNLITVPLALLLGTARLGRILALVQAIKIILCAYLFDHLLTFYCRAPLSRILGASLFGFGGWLILWGQHYWLGAVYVGSVLLALLVELLMERWTVPRFAGLMLATAASILMGVYSGFMVLLFAAIYALLRSLYVSDCHSPSEFLRFFGRLALPVVCGILAAGVMIVPYAYLILNDTTRVTSANGTTTAQRVMQYLTGFVPLQWIPLVASRILGNSLVYTGDTFSADALGGPESLRYLLNSYEFLVVGAGGASLILASQCIVSTHSHASKRQRVVFVAAGILVALFCLNEFLPALFSVFDLKYRASFAVLFALCVASAVGWEAVVTDRKVNWLMLGISGTLTLAILVWSLASTVNGRLVCLAYLTLTAIFSACLVVLTHKATARRPIARQTLIAAACGAAVAMCVVDGFFSTNARDISTVESFPGATDADADTQAALAYLHERDTDFYRIGKTYYDWTFNDSMVQGYSTVTTYNSLVDADVLSFYRKAWPELLGTGSASGSALQMYKNDPYEVATNRLLGIRYILSKQPIDEDWLEMIQQFGSVYVYEDILEEQIGLGSSSFIYESESEADPLSASDIRSILGGTMIVPDEVATTLDLGSFDSSVTRAQEPARLVLEGSSSVAGTMDALADSVACLSIPYTSGWHVLVDDQEVNTFHVDYGFVGFVLPSGAHQINAYYSPVGLEAGIALSLAGLTLGTVSCFLLRKRRDENPQHEANHFKR